MTIRNRLERLERREPDCPDCAPGGLVTFEIADVRPIGSPREEKPEPRFCQRCGRPRVVLDFSDISPLPARRNGGPTE